MSGSGPGSESATSFANILPESVSQEPSASRSRPVFTVLPSELANPQGTRRIGSLLAKNLICYEKALNLARHVVCAFASANSVGYVASVKYYSSK